MTIHDDLLRILRNNPGTDLSALLQANLDEAIAANLAASLALDAADREHRLLRPAEERASAAFCADPSPVTVIAYEAALKASMAAYRALLPALWALRDSNYELFCARQDVARHAGRAA